MLNYRSFKMLFMEELNRRMDVTETEGVFLQRVYKVNQALDAVLFMKTCEESRIAAAGPAFYLNDIYQAYLNGKSIDSLVSELLMQRNMAVPEPVKMNDSLTLETLKPKIYPEMINREHNRCFLESTAYTSIPGLDLAVIYRIVFSEDQNGSMSSVIPWELIREWGISVEELHEIALHNMKEKCTYQIGCFPVPAEIGPIIFLSDSTYSYGAAQLLNEQAVKEAEEIFGGSFFILPCSLHELIMVKYEKEEASRYRTMVREINREVVSPEDWLSDQVYYYDAEDKQVKMAM